MSNSPGPQMSESLRGQAPLTGFTLRAYPFGPLTIQRQKISTQAKDKSVYKRSGLFNSLVESK
jgi:hypothetical protein